MVRQTGHSDAIDILEKGSIYFVYRPTVETHAPRGLPDVERFHMVLRPAGGRLYRLAVIGRKRLPDLNDHERNWGFVQAIRTTPQEVERLLQEERQSTRTRGERTYPAARAAGQGVYAFVQKGRNMHLAYALELPRTAGPVQKALNIAPEGSFVVSIKNPEASSPRAAGLRPEDKAAYPAGKQEEFEGRRFAPSDPELLDFEGAEFILIGADERVRRDLDVDLEPADEDADDARIFRQLRFARSRHPVEPLIQGTWE